MSQGAATEVLGRKRNKEDQMFHWRENNHLNLFPQKLQQNDNFNAAVC